ncbi:hypothetical protein Syun_027458 [Stephania yunnanensis]|uniref:Uncharacterized protein n=1 Tax=Stephania yunnanensis TaxID=152371 RepID=A0AAP0HPZ3_9MAGN
MGCSATAAVVNIATKERRDRGASTAVAKSGVHASKGNSYEAPSSYIFKHTLSLSGEGEMTRESTKGIYHLIEEVVLLSTFSWGDGNKRSQPEWNNPGHLWHAGRARAAAQVLKKESIAIWNLFFS